MKIKSLTSLCFLLLLLGAIAATSADPSLSLDWTQNSGFNMKNGIDGAWTITPLFIVNETLTNTIYVEFYLDNQLQINDTTTPFGWSFDTANYAEGTHTIKVIAYNAIGEFVVAEEQRDFVGFPLISVVGAILFASLVFAFVLIVSWFWIQEKANKRRILKSTLSS